MLTHLRRSAAVLLILFVGHLGVVIGGAVCTTPGMAATSASAPAMDGSMSDMRSPATTLIGARTTDGAKEPAAPGHAPCSDTSQGACVTGMPCVTALSAAATDDLAAPGPAVASGAMALIVTMPVTSGTAPDLPPPRLQV